MGDFLYLCIIPIISKDMLTEYIKDILDNECVEVELIGKRYVITQILDCKGCSLLYEFHNSTSRVFIRIICGKLDKFIPSELYIVKTKTINEPIPE
jgi:hypothetical protein